MKVLAEDFGGGVAVADGGDGGVNGLIDFAFGMFGEWNDLLEGESAVGDGAGFVEAEDVNAGEGFDTGEGLDKGFFAGELQGAYGQSDASEEDEAFRDHADHGGGAAEDGGLEVTGCAELAEEEEGTEWDDDEGEDFYDGVQGVHEWGGGFFHLFGLGGKAAGVAGGANGGDADMGLTGGDEATGQDGVTGFFWDSAGLAGEEAFVDFEGVGLYDDGVSDDLVAGGDNEGVADFDFGLVDFYGLAISDGGDFAAG